VQNKVEITNMTTGEVHCFPTNEKASLFLGKYNNYVSGRVCAGFRSFTFGEYSVKVNDIRKEADSKKEKHFESEETTNIPARKTKKRRGKVESLDEMAKRAREMGISYGKLQEMEYTKNGG